MTIQTPTPSQVRLGRGPGAPAARPAAQEPAQTAQEPAQEPRPAQALASYTIHAISPAGFPVDVHIPAGKIERLDPIFDALLAAGYTAPDTRATPAPAQAGPPMCPVHGKPMKPMNHPDKNGRSHWCTVQTNGTYCQEKA